MKEFVKWLNEHVLLVLKFEPDSVIEEVGERDVEVDTIRGDFSIRVPRNESDVAWIDIPRILQEGAALGRLYTAAAVWRRIHNHE